MTGDRCTNVVLVGLGGQGVVTASSILAEAALRSGLDVKKAELHGMSQRGGGVACDVRFGLKVLSPIVPVGEVDYVVVLAAEEASVGEAMAGPQTVLIAPDCVRPDELPHRRSLNVALLGVLSRHLPFAESIWLEAIRQGLRPEIVERNVQAFAVGRAAYSKIT